MPAELQEQAEAARNELMEMIAESDEELLDQFFSEGELTSEEMLRGLRTAVAARSIFPVVAVTGAHNVGTTALLDLIVAARSGSDRTRARARGQRGRGAGRAGGGRRRAGQRLCVQDHRRPLRRTF